MISPEKAQKSGLFHITFRILIGILTGKTFTENPSSRKSMPESDRHSAPRQMYLISDHPSIFAAGVNLRPKTLKTAMQVTHDTIRSRLPVLHENTTAILEKIMSYENMWGGVEWRTPPSTIIQGQVLYDLLFPQTMTPTTCIKIIWEFDKNANWGAHSSSIKSETLGIGSRSFLVKCAY